MTASRRQTRSDRRPGIDTSGLPFGKGEPRARVKRRRRRTEAQVVRAVRARCVARDGACRLMTTSPTRARLVDAFGLCAGPSEWAHFADHRRYATLGKDAEDRHTSEGSLMLCRGHHAAYDGRALPRMQIEAMSADGCNGRLRFTRNGQTFEETV